MGRITIIARIEDVPISTAEAKINSIKTKLGQITNVAIENIEFTHNEK